MDPASGLCAGCFRTLDEIAGWVDLADEARRALVTALAERRARYGAAMTGAAARGQDDRD